MLLPISWCSSEILSHLVNGATSVGSAEVHSEGTFDAYLVGVLQFWILLDQKEGEEKCW